MKTKTEKLYDSDWRIRKNALEKLIEFPEPDSINIFIQALRDVNDEVAGLAAESLINMGIPAIKPLIDVLLGVDYPLSVLAGETLAKMGNKATKYLADLLPQPRYVGRADPVLAQSTDPEALLYLFPLLQHQDSMIREVIMRALGDSGDTRAVHPIIKNFKSYQATPAAILALGKIGDPRAVTPLIEELKGPECWFAARALGQIGEPAVRSLLEKVNQNEYNQQGVAIYALGLTRSRKVLPSLMELRQHPDPIISWRATLALDEIESQPLKQPVSYQGQYTLTEGFALTTVPSDQYFYAGTVDEILYLPDMDQFLRTPIKPPFPIPCRYSGGKTQPEDFIALNVVGWLISDRIKTLFTENGCTGWDTFPVQLLGKNGEPIKGYHGLWVSGQAGPADYSLSTVQMVPHPVIGLEPDIVLSGLYFPERSWDGSDFFMAPNSTLLMVTPRVVKALEKLKPRAQNWMAEPLAQVKRSIKNETNFSFLSIEQRERLHELRKALGAISLPIVPLLNLFAIGDSNLDEHLQQALIKLGPQAEAALIESIDHPQAEIRRGAALTLREFKSPLALSALIQRMTVETDQETLMAIIRALGSYNHHFIFLAHT